MNDTLKKTSVLLLFLFLLMGIGYADNVANPLSNTIFQMVKILSAIVMAISVLLIVIGGFSYIYSMGDMHSAEKAKNRILFAGIGMFLSMISLTISKIIMQASGVDVATQIDTPAQTNEDAAQAFGISIIVFLLIVSIVYIVYKKTSSASDKEQTSSPMEETRKLEQNQFFSFLEEAYQKCNHFQSDKEEYRSLHSSLTLKTKRNGENIRLHFLYDDISLGESLYHGGKHECVFQSGFEWDTETNTLKERLQSYHEKWLEDYRLQTFSVKDWIAQYLMNIESQEVKENVSQLLERIHQLLSYHLQLSQDDVYLLETTLPGDIQKMLQAYQMLPNDKKTLHKKALNERLNIIASQLDNMDAKIDGQLERDLEYAFRIIDKRYKTSEME